MRGDPPNWTLEVRSAEHLQSAFGDVGLQVADHTNRSKFQKETWVLRRCLTALAAADSIEFPLFIERADRMGEPDFLLRSTSSLPKPVDITEATTPADGREFAISRTTSEASLVGAYGGRCQGGVMGNEAYEMCRDDIIHAVTQKLRKPYANSGMMLLIYVNSNPGIFAEPSGIAEYLNAHAISDGLGRSDVHVLCRDTLIAHAFTRAIRQLQVRTVAPAPIVGP